jgi:hypothetical protein
MEASSGGVTSLVLMLLATAVTIDLIWLRARCAFIISSPPGSSFLRWFHCRSSRLERQLEILPSPSARSRQVFAGQLPASGVSRSKSRSRGRQRSPPDSALDTSGGRAPGVLEARRDFPPAHRKQQRY